MLQSSVGGDVPGATVTSLRPDSLPGGNLPPSVNVYLYQATPNTAWRCADLPTRRADGSLVQRPQAALDLHYLLTFSGNESQLEPQRLLGSVARTLHERPLLTAQMIQDTLADPSFGFLAGSNLADEVERVKFTPSVMSLEELSKLWSVFFQAPYALSTAYQGTVVLIESDETPRTALPVRERNLHVVPFRHPRIERVVSQDGPDQPVVAGSTLLIQGQELHGETTQVRVGGVEVTPTVVTHTQITLPLTTPPLPAGALRAGVQGVQVIHPMLMGTPPVLHRGFESNVAALVLHPTITPTNATAAQITLSVNPAVGRKQRVVLLLDERSAGVPEAFSFVAPPRAADSNSLIIPISGVGTGQYFVRLQVDGAQSPLDLDPGSATPGPLVTIS
jgi:hypothetical protein